MSYKEPSLPERKTSTRIFSERGNPNQKTRPALRSLIVNCIGNICICLADKINELAGKDSKSHKSGTKSIRQRLAEQVAPGAAGPGTAVWDKHEQIINDNQELLEQHLNEYKARGCGDDDGESIPVDAGQLVSREATAEEWEANNPKYSGVTGSALGDAALLSGGLYITYRVIRFIPSLFPPLWPTIPANATVP